MGFEPLVDVVATLARREPEVVRLRSRDATDREQAWQELYRSHFDGIYRLVCRFGVLALEAEDVTQTVFVRAHAQLERCADIRHLRAWLRGIAVRAVAEHLRWRRVRRVKQRLLRATVEASATLPPTPERSCDARERQRLVAEVVSCMSAKLRSVLVLLEIEECTLEETASILQIPINTVRSRRRLAREQFERLWRKRACGEHDEP
jgi:RNA polymerase sigma-70 factor (ECF subfamily)